MVEKYKMKDKKMISTWPSTEKKSNLEKKHLNELIEQEKEYEEFLSAQKRQMPSVDKIFSSRIRDDNEKAREFIYDENTVNQASAFRNKTVYNPQDMDNEFFGKVPVSLTAWMNEEVQNCDDFDIDAPIPKHRELNQMSHKRAFENDFNLKHEFKVLETQEKQEIQIKIEEMKRDNNMMEQKSRMETETQKSIFNLQKLTNSLSAGRGGSIDGLNSISNRPARPPFPTFSPFSPSASRFPSLQSNVQNQFSTTFGSPPMSSGGAPRPLPRGPSFPHFRV